MNIKPDSGNHAHVIQICHNTGPLRFPIEFCRERPAIRIPETPTAPRASRSMAVHSPGEMPAPVAPPHPTTIPRPPPTNGHILSPDHGTLGVDRKGIRMALSPKRAKAVRIVLEGRVTIGEHTDDITTATVEGDTGTYTVILDPGGSACDCPAGEHGMTCSHILATLLEIERRAKGVDIPDLQGAS